MSRSYQVNVRKVNHKTRNKTAAIYTSLILLLALLIWVAAHFLLSPNTKIKHSAAVVTKVSTSSSSNLKVYNASDFTFKMSPGWVKDQINNSPYHIYEWIKNSSGTYQKVDIFEDSSTSNLAVNRVIIVAANGNKLSVLGPPSDNCANFTVGTKTSTLTGYPAKWMGVPFNCDLNSTSNDTIGISSAVQINSVNLISQSSAHHSFYYLYTNNTYSPDYSDFEELLNSFTLQ